jgi:dUTP pyrophosphatase
MGKMNNDDIKKYIDRLKSLEIELSNDDGDLSFIGELDSILDQLNTDIKNQMKVDENVLNVKYKKLTDNAVEPSYAKHGDAGLDLTITSIISETDTNITYGFGISVEIPFGYVGLLFPRSSVRNFQIILSNCVGVIDSGYRGEIQATFKKTNTEAISYQVNERGAQLIIMPYPQIRMVQSDELSSTERGDKGYGSSGI